MSSINRNPLPSSTGRFNTDHYYEMGSSHLTCDDYALSGKVGDSAYAIVADGCSSSANSEVGSRILTHIAEAWIRSPVKEYSFRLYASVKMSRICQDLSVDETMMDSTLLLATANKNEVQIVMYGDGVAIIRFMDGRIAYHHVDYSNMPFYLSYFNSVDRHREYLNAFHRDESKKVVVESSCAACDKRQFDRVFDSIYEDTSLTLPINDISSITLASDGIHTYQQEQPDLSLKDIPFVEMINRISAYKNFNGDFVKRRMAKLKRDCIKDKTVHFDDISIASIHI